MSLDFETLKEIPRLRELAKMVTESPCFTNAILAVTDAYREGYKSVAQPSAPRSQPESRCADNDPDKDCPCGGRRGRPDCMFPDKNSIPDAICPRCGWYLEDKSGNPVPSDSPRSAAPTPEELAQKFHESYERLAPEFGYKTCEQSAKPWTSVPVVNQQLMIAVCAEMLDLLAEKR